MGTDKISYLMTTPVPVSARVLLMNGGAEWVTVPGDTWYVHVVRRVWPWRWRWEGWGEPVLKYLWGRM